jgi:hypothetical protein
MEKLRDYRLIVLDESMKEYQRFLTKGFKPFNSLELAKEAEKIVTTEGLERKYPDFQSRIFRISHELADKLMSDAKQ